MTTQPGSTATTKGCRGKASATPATTTATTKAMPTKSDTVIKLLLRARGATSLELIAATDWQAHSIRAFLSGLRKKGRVLVREARKSGEFAYRLKLAAKAAPALVTEPAAPRRDGERMSMIKLASDLTALAMMSPAQLRAEWRRLLRTLPPEVPTDILRRGLAYRLQERAMGGLPAATVRELDRIAARLTKGQSTSTASVRLKPGTRLVRRWQGKTYTISVIEDGFVLDDRRFASLSHVAEAITGTHWSGPRFFGLGKAAKVPAIVEPSDA